ncbi:MAG: hypothetical protein IKF83_03030 [Clostridia bacterium]|nr:hypothetical protein [Clostridia bacterium]
MENATKALLISAGVIFAVVIFSAMFYIYQMVSGYYQSKESNLTTEQLAQVNDEFSVYQRDLTGFELVSLINKVVNFNKDKADGEGYSKITVKVKIPNNSKLGYNGTLFNNKRSEANLSYDRQIIPEPPKTNESDYEDYLTFKRGTFEYKNGGNNSGQISNFEFEQKVLER